MFKNLDKNLELKKLFTPKANKLNDPDKPLVLSKFEESSKSKQISLEILPKKIEMLRNLNPSNHDDLLFIQ